MNEKNEDLKLVKETFLKDLVIVTGSPTAGKSMLAPIVASLERAENFKMSILLEHLGTLNYLGKLPDDVLVFLLRYTVDFMLYDNMIGRNMNFRFQDETSIWNTNNPAKYFERLLAERGEFVVDQIHQERPLLILALSDAFWHAKRWFEAFPFLKLVYVSRYPVDTAYSWYNHRYGEEVRLAPQAKSTGITDHVLINTYNITVLMAKQRKPEPSILSFRTDYYDFTSHCACICISGNGKIIFPPDLKNFFSLSQILCLKCHGSTRR